MQNTYMNKMLQRIADAVERWTGGSINIDVTGAGDMHGATSTSAGVHGLVPAPAAGDENKVLCGSGTWIDGGSDVAELGDLADVDITSPTSGESLKYDGSKWVNGNVTADLPDFIEETSGSIVTVNAAERPAKSLVVAINPVQSGSGDPSPTNIRPISGWTGANIVVSPTLNAQDGTTYSITFPSEEGTVYGGTLDVTNGVLTVTMAEVDLGTLNYTRYTPSSTNIPVFYSPVNGVTPSSGGRCKSSAYTCKYWSSLATRTDYTIEVHPTLAYIYVADSRYEAVADFKSAISGVQFVYPLATPITYQLTPTVVQMLLGTNNIWADTGEVKELKYINQTYNDLLAEMTGGGVSYSTAEQYTGLKWIDGSKIYQKTIDFGTMPVNSEKDVSHGISNLAFVVDIEFIVYDSAQGQWRFMPAISRGNIMAQSAYGVNSQYVFVLGGEAADVDSNWSGIVTIRYTKL